MMDAKYVKLLESVIKMLDGREELEVKLHMVCRLLRSSIPGYDWVGFYMVVGDELVLGPFSGAPTEHTNIPFGEGICGQAAERKETYVVPYVSREENYLPCSPLVRSEIVVPIMVDGLIVGELDIDSHGEDTFTPGDREFLEAVCHNVARSL